MASQRTMKDVQHLTKRLAALSHFISKATDRRILLFKILKGAKKFEWTDECKKKHLKS